MKEEIKEIIEKEFQKIEPNLEEEDKEKINNKIKDLVEKQNQEINNKKENRQ